MNFSYEEILLLLDALRYKYGSGYSSVPEVGSLQAYLSLWLEVKAPKNSEG